MTNLSLWTRSTPTDRMVLDSGATQHFFRSSTKLYNKKPAELKIHTVNGITISHEKGDYDDGILNLKNVYVVPSSAENLISINQLTKQGYIFKCDNEKLVGYLNAKKWKQSDPTFIAKHENGVWVYQNPENANSALFDEKLDDEIMRIHITMAHASPKMVKQLLPQATEVTEKEHQVYDCWSW